MKATSRRRVLISSVAMLLVAMLALGTATFAWFTTTADANANDINVKTTKSSYLQVSKLDLQWADTVDYIGSTALALKPASSVDGTNWYYGEAANKSSYAIASNGTFTKCDAAKIGNSGTGLYVYKEMLNIKNAGQGQVKRVTITISAEDMDSTARLAVVPATDAQTTGGTFPAFTAPNFKANIYASTGSITWNGVSATTVSSTAAMPGSGNTVKAADGATISVGSMAAGEVKSYVLFVWFEGQDTNLYDMSSNAFTVPDISFNVTGDTAAE